MNGNSADAAAYAGQMRQKLQALLDDKERQLQKAEALGQRILAQQMELEERINQITELDEQQQQQDGENGADDSEMRSQLDELAQTMHGWATENEGLWTGAVTKVIYPCCFEGLLADPPLFRTAPARLERHPRLKETVKLQLMDLLLLNHHVERKTRLIEQTMLVSLALADLSA